MTITDDILVKEISGNSTPDEANLVSEWKGLLPENAIRYNELKLIWENSVLLKSEFTPDIENAWQNVSKTINKPKSFPLFKIAAAIIILISIGVLIKQFVFAPSIVDKENETLTENSTNNKSDNNAEESNTKHVKTFKILTQDSIKEVFLQDSSLVILNANSTISYKDFDVMSVRKVHLDGQANFDVVHSNKDFIVVTDYVGVKVIGTNFTVNENKENNEVDIIVEEGKVEAYELKKKKNKVTINSGEKYTFDIAKHTFKKIDGHHKKEKWWKGFLSKFRRFIDRIKHRKSAK